jgi:hypothetical protein
MAQGTTESHSDCIHFGAELSLISVREGLAHALGRYLICVSGDKIDEKFLKLFAKEFA